MPTRLVPVLALALALSAAGCGTGSVQGTGQQVEPSPAPTTAAPSPSTPVASTTPSTAPVTPTPSASSAASADFLDAADRLTLEGIGPVRIGMTLAQATDAAGVPVVEQQDSRLGDCAFAVARGAGPDVSFMVLGDRIARVDVDDDSPVVTRSGVGIGDTEARVREVYGGRVDVEPHEYEAHGHYLVLREGDPQLGLVFETDGEVVTRFRSGTDEAVGYVEGCA